MANLTREQRAERDRLAAKVSQTDASALAEADDASLGIGVEDDAPAPDVSALLSNPELAAMIAQLVEQQVAARLGTPKPRPEAGSSDAAFMAYIDSLNSKFEHMLESHAEQRPGYIKPLTAAELDARKQGERDMRALLRRFKAEGIWPHYLIGDENNPYYGSSPNGPILYQAGQEIKIIQAPAEGWEPLNDAAIQVVEAYRRWVGDVVPVEELIARQARLARGQSAVPEIVAEDREAQPEVILVDVPARDVSPKRVMGTVVNELRGKPMPTQPGITQAPIGPVFVDS